MIEETTLSSDEHCKLLEYVLELYGKNMSNIVAIIGDNVEMNKCLATNIGIPLVGCASHRFALAVKSYLTKFEPILDKINGLMGKLKTIKMRAKLGKLTHFHPVQRNETRWSSVAEMVDSYMKIKDVLHHFKEEAYIVGDLLDAKEELSLTLTNSKIKIFESVTKALQSEAIYLASVRKLFDETMKKIPDFDKEHRYLCKNPSISKFPDFENAVVKILENREADLTDDEKEAVGALQLEGEVNDEKENENPDDFATTLLKKRQKTVNKSHYLDLRFIIPTSDIIERFFSSAGYASNDLRQRLVPATLEEQLFLKVNRRFWTQKTVNDVL